jgi:hypothetical protein
MTFLLREFESDDPALQDGLHFDSLDVHVSKPDTEGLSFEQSFMLNPKKGDAYIEPGNGHQHIPRGGISPYVSDEAWPFYRYFKGRKKEVVYTHTSDTDANGQHCFHMYHDNDPLFDYDHNVRSERYMRLRMAFASWLPAWASWIVEPHVGSYDNGNLCSDMFTVEFWVPLVTFILHLMNAGIFVGVVWPLLAILSVPYTLTIAYLFGMAVCSDKITHKHSYYERWRFMSHFSAYLTYAMPAKVGSWIECLGRAGHDPADKFRGSFVPFLVLFVYTALGPALLPVAVAVQLALASAFLAAWPVYVVFLYVAVRPMVGSRARAAVAHHMRSTRYWLRTGEDTWIEKHPVIPA